MMSLPMQVQPLVAARPVVPVGLGVVREAERGDVVAERVHPHVEDVVGLLGHRDAPLDPGAAHAEVLEPLLDDAQDLVLARVRPDAQPVGLDRLAQPGLVRREAEEEVLLLGPLAGPLVVGADVVRLAQLLLVLEALAARAVPAAVLPEVDRVPAVGRLRLAQARPQLQDAPAVDVLGGPDEAVVADVVPVPQRAERRRDDVAVLLLGDAPLARDPLDVLPVLVGAGQEEDVLPPEAPRARQRVGGDRRVGVADVRHVVDVVDRRRDDRNALGGAHRLPGFDRAPRGEGGGERLLHRHALLGGRPLAVVELGPRVVDRLAPAPDLDTDRPVGGLDRDGSRARGRCGPTPAAARRGSSSPGRAAPRGPRASPASAMTVTRTPGRPFFICTGVKKASFAPCASSRSRSGPRSCGTASSSSVSSTRTRSPLDAAASSPTIRRSTFGRPFVSRPPAPWPVDSIRIRGSGPYSVACAVTRRAPVGVSSSPSPSP